MKTLMLVAIGGAIGAVARYSLSSQVYHWLGSDFPWGTMIVNVLGSFLMGFLFFLMAERIVVSGELRTAVLVGGLGAFTTFSTFSIETINLIQRGTSLTAILNICFSVVVCMAAVWVGMRLARSI